MWNLTGRLVPRSRLVEWYCRAELGRYHWLRSQISPHDIIGDCFGTELQKNFRNANHACFDQFKEQSNLKIDRLHAVHSNILIELLRNTDQVYLSLSQRKLSQVQLLQKVDRFSD